MFEQVDECGRFVYNLLVAGRGKKNSKTLDVVLKGLHCTVSEPVAGYDAECSLLANDHDDVREFSPWLASLYVLEAHRCRGVGRALAGRIVADAAALGVGTLYLYTRDVQRYYERLGWKAHARCRFDALEVDVMSIEPAAAVAAGLH